MTFEGAECLSGSIPKPDSAIGAGGGDYLTIRAEGEIKHLILVTD